MNSTQNFFKVFIPMLVFFASLHAGKARGFEIRNSVEVERIMNGKEGSPSWVFRFWIMADLSVEVPSTSSESKNLKIGKKIAFPIVEYLSVVDRALFSEGTPISRITYKITDGAEVLVSKNGMHIAYIGLESAIGRTLQSKMKKVFHGSVVESTVGELFSANPDLSAWPARRRLKELDLLFKDRLINEAEYHSMRKEILDGVLKNPK